MRETIIFSWLLLSVDCAAAQIAEKRPEITSPTPPAAPTNAKTPGESQTVKAGDFTLILEKNCRLTYERTGKKQSFTFPFTAPCQFSKNDSDAIRLVKQKRNFVVAVESSQPKNNAESGSISKDCETFVRGVVVSKNSVRLSTQTQKAAMCLPFVWDEKMFTVFAGKTEPFPESP